MHRLNRTEYANAIRDLLALDVDVSVLLPADASSDGFDNIADALSVSPSLIQGYVTAAMKISRRAVGDRTLTPTQVTYPAPGGLAQDRHIEGLPLGTRGGMLVHHTFPLDAEYEFSVTGGVGFGGGGGGAAVDVTLDGEKIATTTPRSFRLNVTAGPHTIGAALVDKVRSAGVDDAYSDFRNNSTFTAAGGVQTVVITGPYKAISPGDTPSRRRVLVCKPSPAEETTCARQDRDDARAPGVPASAAARRNRAADGLLPAGSQRDGFRNGHPACACARPRLPAFLFRVETEPKGLAAGATYRLSDLDLASRLSFFLWSSIPTTSCSMWRPKGRLRDPKVLDRQGEAHARGSEIVRARRRTSPVSGFTCAISRRVQTSAKDFDDNLRQAFRRETEMLFRKRRS